MFWVRKTLMTYQSIEPRPLATVQTFHQLSRKVEEVATISLSGRGRGGEGEGTRIRTESCIQQDLYEVFLLSLLLQEFVVILSKS